MQTLCKPQARKNGSGNAGRPLCVADTISRGRVSHSDSGLNTVSGVLSCPWFVNDWHSLRIMPLEAVLIWRDALCKPQSRKSGSAVLILGALYKPCANHRRARMALVMLGGHSVWLTPISRGRVSHSDSGLNTVGGVLSCPWFVNDWHSLRIMPLEAVLICLKCSLR